MNPLKYQEVVGNPGGRTSETQALLTNAAITRIGRSMPTEWLQATEHYNSRHYKDALTRHICYSGHFHSISFRDYFQIGGSVHWEG